MIKEIYCFGTSMTAGGGFEFDSNLKRDILLQIYNEEPFTQYNYSYPGQLQKIIGDEIKVYNYGKSGHGNERMYRKAFDVIENSDNMDDKLFILEFSLLGRKEVWSNTFNKHLIVNYQFNDDESLWVTAITDKYFISDKKIEEELRNVIEPYMKETIKFEVQEKLLNRNVEFFVDYLLYNKINFLVVQEPKYEKTKNKIKPYTLNFGDGITNMNQYAYEKNLTISKETKGKYVDPHGGLVWAKHVANKIANKYDLNKTNISQII